VLLDLINQSKQFSTPFCLGSITEVIQTAIVSDLLCLQSMNRHAALFYMFLILGQSLIRVRASIGLTIYSEAKVLGL
jgi:hypothetical protein